MDADRARDPPPPECRTPSGFGIGRGGVTRGSPQTGNPGLDCGTPSGFIRANWHIRIRRQKLGRYCDRGLCGRCHIRAFVSAHQPRLGSSGRFRIWTFASTHQPRRDPFEPRLRRGHRPRSSVTPPTQTGLSIPARVARLRATRGSRRRRTHRTLKAFRRKDPAQSHTYRSSNSTPYRRRNPRNSS